MVKYVSIEGDAIVMRIPFKVIPTAVEGAWSEGHRSPRLKVTDAESFAKGMVVELNRESENGTTALDLLLDKAAYDACENGAEGVEIHEVQEP